MTNRRRNRCGEDCVKPVYIHATVAANVATGCVDCIYGAIVRTTVSNTGDQARNWIAKLYTKYYRY